MNVVTKASRELFKRPSDEIFASFGDIIEHLSSLESRTSIVDVDNTAIAFPRNVDPDEGGGIDLFLKSGAGAMNDWSARQLCRVIGFPFAPLNGLSAHLASAIINEKLIQPNNFKEMRAHVVKRDDGKKEFQAFYSKKYERVSDLKVFRFWNRLADNYGYEPAGTFAGKRGGMAAVRPECSGLYRGQRNSFGFIANEEGAVEIDGGSQLYHAIMFWNSEVGDKPLAFAHCYYNFICGNHMLWGVKRYQEKSHRHVGRVNDLFHEAELMVVDIEKRRDDLAKRTSDAVSFCQTHKFASSVKKAVDELAEKYTTAIAAREIMNYAQHEKGYAKDPLSLWGVAQGVTLYSQTIPYMSDRSQVEKIASKIMERNVGVLA